MKYRVIAFLSFLSIAFFVHGQAVQEKDISFDILKWHFHHYPQSVSSGWKKGENATRIAFFEHEGEEYKVVYKENGQRVSEEMDMIDRVPVSVIYYLDENYGKYKVNEFLKVTDFDTDDVHFRLEVKSKERGAEVLKFDENLILIDFTLLSKAD